MKIFSCLIALALLCSASFAKTNYIGKSTINRTIQLLLKLHGEKHRFRIQRGVEQAARFWTQADGNRKEFSALAQKYFIASEDELNATFKKFEVYSEILYGYFGEMAMDLRQTLDLDWGPIQPIDLAFGQMNPAAHVIEDLFKNKIAFFSLINFPRYTLAELSKKGDKWDRRQWAYARLGSQFSSRIPAEINKSYSMALSQADVYISEYNIYVGNLVDDQMNTYFPKDLKLVSHWGLRDELKEKYADPKGLYKQKMIYKVMQRIIDQDIPQKVINNKDLKWNPFTNQVYKGDKAIKITKDPDTRYAHLLNVFNAIQKVDAHQPYLKTHVLRQFERAREIPEAEVEAIFKELLSSNEIRQVAKLLEKRLGRKLAPFDIFYTGFNTNSSFTGQALDELSAKKYPNLQAYESGIKEILIKLGFDPKMAKNLADKIRVDPARGAGHCGGASMKSAKSRLRTRVPEGGMSYKGYTTAMHELGHAVEQVLTLNYIDYYSLNGVPNTAFTEAFAFVFQDRNLEVLGVKPDQDQARAKHNKTLNLIWDIYHSMAVSLVDMRVWNWMYAHPKANATQLKKAVIKIAKSVWNQYFAPVFGVRDQNILAIYSHMIAYPLYLPDYPVGMIIQYQLEDYMADKNLAEEMQRMCAAGNIIPQLWMKKAVGSKISVKPLLKAAARATKALLAEK